jgi:hypothetical protein
MKGKSRSLVLGAVLTFSLLMVAPAFAAATYPTSMAVMGDSISSAYGAEGGPGDYKVDSYATGIFVNSFAVRLAARLGIDPSDYPAANLAIPGRTMDRIDEQAAGLSGGTQWVVLNGLNTELCGSQVDTVAELKSQAWATARVREALAAIKAKASGARIYVVSVPNWYALWAKFKDDSDVSSLWAGDSGAGRAQSCPLLFKSGVANSSSRSAIRGRINAYNASLAEACSEVAGCRFDRKAFFNTAFTKGRLSDWDGFHPSVAGQEALAASAWLNSPWSLKSQGIKTKLRELRRRRVSVTIDGAANATMKVQFREAGRLLGTKTVTLDATGHAAFIKRLATWHSGDLRIRFIETLNGERYVVTRTLNS